MDRFTVTFSTKSAVPSAYWGSLMHGMFMRRLPAPLAEGLHEVALRPFSQWVEPADAHTFRWHVQVMDDALAQNAAPLLTAGAVWDCEHLREQLTITACERESITLQAWVKDFFLTEQPHRNLQLTLHTATTHKTAGRYALFPSVELAALSLQKRITELDSRSVFAEDDVLRQIIDAASITRYRLQSCTYALEGVRLPGFLGTVELAFRGPDPLLRLTNMLFSFAAWSGLGAKTALGMGGCTVCPMERPVRRERAKICGVPAAEEVRTRLDASDC